MQRPALKQPPWLENSEGSPRRVGVELEMNGLTLDALAEGCAKALDLSVESVGRYERRLVGDPAGDWGVELDFALLKRLGREQRDGHTLAGGLGNSVEEVLAWLAETLVPLEVVSPPLPFDQLGRIEDLIEALRRAGARGTSDRPTNAFGMQLNPEFAVRDTAHIVALIKAFLCLVDWLTKRVADNTLRHLTHYIDPFPRRYVRRVIDPDYWPDEATLIDDYLADNPTRNRALDLLPLFAWLDEPRLRRVVDDPLVKARPALHYRLPDCEIDQPGWGLHTVWNDWVEVERLAADRDRLNGCCRDYATFLANPLRRTFRSCAHG